MIIFHLCEIANKLLARHFSLLVRCLHNKKNNTCLLGDVEFFFVFNSTSHSFAALTRREISS